MAFVRQLLNKPVTDTEGESVGILTDIIASRLGAIPQPALRALSIKRGQTSICVPIHDTTALDSPTPPHTIILHHRLRDIPAYHPSEQDLHLARDVLDKQIIDINGARVVRVSDVEVAKLNGHFYIVNVDVGGRGWMRRLRTSPLVKSIAQRLGRPLPEGIIAWRDVEFLPDTHRMQLKVPGSKMAELHPADIAEIISQLNRAEGGLVLQQLDVKTVADTLEEVEPEFQASLVESMPDEKVADVLEEMSPDAAADLLAELPEDRSAEILNLMEREDAEDVRELLKYPDDSAGGLMTTDYFTVGPDLTAGQAIDLLRQSADEVGSVSYIYVTDQNGTLIGVLSLQELVLAQPNTLVRDIMHRRFVHLNLMDSQDVAAKLIAKYSLTALPVLDAEGKLRGIVTADDALDKIIPTAWKKRLPKFHH
ncbi:MAG: CBS domain-containing protein [Anaerolineae bacterium]|nr:CBS domain-containing protein [Thermoflexales bacterium]MDW8406565.1 CBS domain-containing protein [Anaerolineae bacterium]